MDLLDIFGQLDDPRIERKKLRSMLEILLLTLSAVRLQLSLPVEREAMKKCLKGALLKPPGLINCEC